MALNTAKNRTNVSYLAFKSVACRKYNWVTQDEPHDEQVLLIRLASKGCIKRYSKSTLKRMVYQTVALTSTLFMSKIL